MSLISRMEAVLFITAYVLMLTIPASVITAIVVISLRASRLVRTNRVLWIVIAGSVVPGAMVLYGLVLSWPWPWRQPDALQDMIPPGPGLLLSAFPAWLLSLTVSWVVLRRGGGNGS